MRKQIGGEEICGIPKVSAHLPSKKLKNTFLFYLNRRKRKRKKKRGMEEEEEGAKLSIYKAARRIKRRDNSLYNALRSIYQDSIFVSEISLLWPQLPLLANLRCGLWYSRAFHSTCYFKSTDGHTNNCSFSTARLNLHVAQLAGTLFYHSQLSKT